MGTDISTICDVPVSKGNKSVYCRQNWWIILKHDRCRLDYPATECNPSSAPPTWPVPARNGHGGVGLCAVLGQHMADADEDVTPVSTPVVRRSQRLGHM